MEQAQVKEHKAAPERTVDPVIFGVSASLTVLFIIWSVAFPDSMNAAVKAVFASATKDWGWLYLLVTFILVASCFLLMVSTYGGVKLGKPGDVPEFSNFSWFAMLFGAGICAGIVFWGPAEPAYHFMSPPPYFGAAAAKSAEAAQYAMTQSFFHWGLSAWAIYLGLTLPLAHACFTKGLPFRFSSAFYYVLGDRVFGGWGKFLDILAVFATLGGMATTLGLIALQVGSGLKYHYGVDVGASGAYIIIGILTVLFTTTVYTGLDRGIKLAGRVNMYIFMGLWAAVLVFGPTLYLISLTTNSIGQYLQNFLGLSLYTGVGTKGADWLGDWTIFYWAWWMSWAPFVSTFIARISKGRTIRTTVAATLLLPTVACILWYGVIGGAGIKFDVTDVVNKSGVAAAIFATMEHLPATGLFVFAVMVLIATFSMTASNAASMALSMFVSGKENPNRNLRAFWGVCLGAVAAVLAATGGLKAIQTASIATAWPLLFLFLLAVVGTYRGLSGSGVKKD